MTDSDRVFKGNLDLDDLIERLQALKQNYPELSDFRVSYDEDKMNGWFDYRPIRSIFVDQEDGYILLSPQKEIELEVP